MRSETILTILAICSTVVITTLLATFIQSALHFVLGHHRIGGWFFRNHVKCHHTIYSGRKLATAEYEDEETSLTLFYFFPCAAACLTAYLILPRILFWVHCLTFALMFGLHVYVHIQFHVRKSWLNHFGRFRRLRRLHNIHHLNHRKNFALIQPFWDRIFGSFQAKSQKARKN